MRGYKDAVIEALADSEAELQDRVASLEADVQDYSLLAKLAIHHLHEAKVRHDRTIATNRRLHDELREAGKELARLRQEHAA